MAATKSSTNAGFVDGLAHPWRRTLRWAVIGVLTVGCGDEPKSGSRADASIASGDATVGKDAGGGAAQIPPSLAVSPTHACALRKAGVYCWGDNFAGQLGNGNTTTSAAPVQASVVGKDVAELVAATGTSAAPLI